MIHLMQKLRKRRGTYYYVVVTTVAAVITGTINYLYHPMMIRYLSSADFAIFQSLMSMFNIFSVVSAGLGMYLTQQFSKHADNPQQLSALKRYRKWFAIKRGIVLFSFFVCLSPLLTSYLHLPSFRLVILVAFSYLFTGYVIVFGWLLQGTHKFEHISGILIAGAICRVSFGAVAMRLDLGVAGAIAAVSIGSLVWVTLQWLSTRKIAEQQPTHDTEIRIVDDFRSHLPPITFFASVAVVSMLLSQIDIFVVQHKYFGDEAGIYVAVSVLAKFIFFLAGSVETVYYPQLSKSVVHHVSRIQVRNYLTLLAFVIVGGYLGSRLLGGYVLYLFKPTLVGYADWLQWLLIGSGSIFVFTTILKLLVAWKQKRCAMVLIGFGLLVMVWLHIAADSISSFVHVYTWSMVVLALCALVLFRYTLHTHKQLSVTELGTSEI